MNSNAMFTMTYFLKLYYCCGRNTRLRQDNDLINYEYKSISLDQEHEYQDNARLELITGSLNNT